MPLSPEALEQQEKEALRKWASSKYAISEGYPIPQWRQGLKWFLGNSPDKDFEESLWGMLYHAYGAEEITAGPHEGEILIADRYQVLIVNRRLNCVFSHGSKNTIDIADGTQGFATFNHELGDEGRILWSMRNGNRIQEIDVATGDVTLDWSISMPTATYEYETGGRPPNPSFTGNILVAERGNDRVRKYDRDQSVVDEITGIPNPDHATEMGGGGPKVSLGSRDVGLSLDSTWTVLDFGDAWPQIASINRYADGSYAMTGASTRGLVGFQDGMFALTPYVCERRLTLTPRLSALGTQHGQIQEFRPQDQQDSVSSLAPGHHEGPVDRREHGVGREADKPDGSLDCQDIRPVHGGRKLEDLRPPVQVGQAPVRHG